MIKKDNPISSGSTYWLSEKEINVLEEQAYNGEANAAFRLYQYHMFVSFNQELEHKWLIIAARQGHTIARNNLVKLSLDENNE